MKIYIDGDYRCHTSNDGTMREMETEFFDGKCERFIEGYRFVPSGAIWVRPDGVAFAGEMIAPWQDYRILAAFQEQYTQSQAIIDDQAAALAAIYTGVMQ